MHITETPSQRPGPLPMRRVPLREGLWRARGAIAFAVGLLMAGVVAMQLDRQMLRDGRAALLDAGAVVNRSSSPRPLTAEELAMARTAWAYFATHTRPETGWPDSVGGFPSTTMWDLSSYLLALPAAHRLGLIDRGSFLARAGKALRSLADIPLFEGRLPNKSYDTITLGMTDYDGNPTAEGIGWSALDIARLLIALATLERTAPELAPLTARIRRRFDLRALTEEGYLVGAIHDPASGATYHLQEGRTGYEEYAARGAALAGLDVMAALRVEDHGVLQRLYGIPVLTDDRRGKAGDAQSTTLSEPYLLTAFELGLDTVARAAADRLYRVQKARFERTGILTSLSEDHLDRAPFFLYGTVIGNGIPWAVLDEDGNDYPALRTFSAKAALGWSLLYEDADPEHARRLRAALAPLATDQGWYAGIYERTGEPNRALTANTNGVILEALHYRAFGPLLLAGTGQ